MISPESVISDLPKPRQRDEKKRKRLAAKVISSRTILLTDLGADVRNVILESQAHAFEMRRAHTQAAIMRSKKTA